MSASSPGDRRRAAIACARWALAAAAVWALPSFGADAGQGPDQPAEDPKLGDEDREVVQNLELLENLDASQDLDLLLELSKKDDEAAKQ